MLMCVKRLFLYSVDGGWATWNTWTPCDVTCGNGTRLRDRVCTNPTPAYGGLDCEGRSTEETSCVLEACPGKRTTITMRIEPVNMRM